ncbi:MAG: copper-translocating P-type ATPase [Candidatus Doudnabacteria bacterium RIFCSPHIGHO2_01_FULL_50_67]|nr:MAG: copper-translocating P-type ATPase [Candidatus Doudnabacteria bacterium RIFCSPHIGHO2_01_FULL_50_67]
MNLVPAKKKRDATDHLAHDKHAGHSTTVFKTKFWLSFLLTAPIVAYSEIVEEFLGWTPPVFPGSDYLPFVLSTVIFFYGGWVFISSAYRELRAKLPGMMTLIALAISVAYFYSVAVTFLGEEGALFWELATLITIMLLGHWLEMRAVRSAQGALKELSRLLPDRAEVIRNGTTRFVVLTELKRNDLVIVKPGGRVPADGVIKEGVSDVNEAVATGESKPISKKAGDEVIAGTTNGDGSLTVEVTKIGEETFLAGVMRLVAEAENSKSRLQMLSDRAAYYLTIVAVVTGVVTVAVWLAIADPSFAINRMVAVLVVACPHALGLAIPLVVSISTAKASRSGFLVRQRQALEGARLISMVVFDKTGTLTRGEFEVSDLLAEPGVLPQELLRFAASVNAHSEHQIGRALLAAAKSKNIALSAITNFSRIPARGAKAFVGEQEVAVGSDLLAAEAGFEKEIAAVPKLAHLRGQGKSVIHVIAAGKFLGSIALGDTIRPESREAIARLKRSGVKVAMLTGDSPEVAEWAAGDLGIKDYFAQVSPAEKAAKLKFWKDRGERVAMVGDGVNDAPALAAADLGIAIGAGTNVALESAGIILVKNDPRDIPRILRLSRLTYAKMMQNLFWATGYNVAAIPLAAGVFSAWGVFLEPAVSAALMSLSTVIVAVNALLLKNKKI